MARTRKLLSVELTEREHVLLKAAAARDQRTVAATVRRALVAYGVIPQATEGGES